MRLFIFFIVLFFAFGCSKESSKTTINQKNSNTKNQAISTQDEVFDFSLKSTTGETITLSKYRGRVVLIDFWGVWCPPCKKMIPVLAEFVNQCSDKGVVLLGIHSVSNFPGAEDIDFFAGQMGVNYPMLIGTPENEKKFDIKAFPTLIIIGPDGKIKHRFVGYHSVDEIRKEVRKELDKIQ
ncbi:TlpA family protein disulfide reductase [bacterium]|nr:TlpA family protein disulfide reductase [bacterium]